jgi:hypothetical protein
MTQPLWVSQNISARGNEFWGISFQLRNFPSLVKVQIRKLD